MLFLTKQMYLDTTESLHIYLNNIIVVMSHYYVLHDDKSITKCTALMRPIYYVNYTA